MTKQRRVKACQPPTLAIDVDGITVPVEPPSMLGNLARVDLVVEETNPEHPDGQVRVVMGVPCHQPMPPAAIYNLSVQQRPLATVQVRRHQILIQDCDIASIEEWRP